MDYCEASLSWLASDVNHLDTTCAVETPQSPRSEDYQYAEITTYDTPETTHQENSSHTFNPYMRRIIAAPTLDPRYVSNRMLPSQYLYQTPYLYFSTDDNAGSGTRDLFHQEHVPRLVKPLPDNENGMFHAKSGGEYRREQSKYNKYSIPLVNNSLVAPAIIPMTPQYSSAFEHQYEKQPQRSGYMNARNSPEKVYMKAEAPHNKVSCRERRQWDRRSSTDSSRPPTLDNKEGKKRPNRVSGRSLATVSKPKKRVSQNSSGKVTREPREENVDWYLSVSPDAGNLDEMFRTEKYLDHIGSLGRCQVSCRMLQTHLECSDARLFDRIVTALMKMGPALTDTVDPFSEFVHLMMDPFGNYLCQKVMERSTSMHLVLIQKSIAPHVLVICLNSHGSRAMQKFIDIAVRSLPKTSLWDLCAGFHEHVVATLVCNKVGNHVISRFLKLLPESCSFITNALHKHVSVVSRNRYGCCVLQRTMDSCKPDQRHVLCSAICDIALPLIQDTYGNYVVQYVVSKENPTLEKSYCELVCDQIMDHIVSLATQKFSSNVIERCLQGASDAKRCQMIQEISRPESLSTLLKDAFGNYVVQIALNVAHNGYELDLMMKNLAPFVEDDATLDNRVRRNLQKKLPDHRTETDSTPTSPLTPLVTPTAKTAISPMFVQVSR